MSPAEQRAAIAAAVATVERAYPRHQVFGIPAPDVGAPELQRPGGWTIVGWVQRHGAIEVESLLVCVNAVTGDRKLKKGWAPHDAPA